MANTVVGPTYITGTQLAVVETLLVGLRKKCISDFYATYIEGYLKVECTRILLEAGYSTLEFYDPASHTATLLSLPDSSARPEATLTVPVGSDVHDKSERDVITHKPFVHFELRCFSEVGTTTVNNEDLEHGMDRLLVSSINVLVVACSVQVYTSYQERFPVLLAPVATLQPYFSDSEQHYTRKESQKSEEFTLRACKIASPIPATSRVIFAIFRPSTLQKQVEHLLEAKATLEQEKSEMQDDTVVLASELESLKMEMSEISTDRESIHIGKGEFEAERDLIREERNELAVECEALKQEMGEMRKEMQKLELELEVFRDESNKKLLLSDDDNDIEVNNQVDLNDDDSIELEGSDTEAKTTADLNLDNDEESEDELEKVKPIIESESSDSDTPLKSNQIVVEDDDGEDSDVSVEVDEKSKAESNKNTSADLQLDSGSDDEVLLKKNETPASTKLEEQDIDDDGSDWSDS